MQTPWQTMIAATLLAAQPALGADLKLGERIVMQGNDKGALACVSCHGANGEGNAAAGFPRLSILDADHMVKQLEDYKQGSRKNPVMQPFAAALSAEEMEAVAAYYESRKPQAAASEGAPEAPPLGERLALRGAWNADVPACVSCHGPGGKGITPDFPAIAGQHAGYIKSQLQAWKSGTRTNDPNELMKSVAERLSEEQMEAVAAYFASRPVAD